MDWLAYLLVALVLVAAGVWAFMRYKRHSAAAHARSRAALNRLLAESDEIEQREARVRREAVEQGAPLDPPE
jgi:hypothetical protein